MKLSKKTLKVFVSGATILGLMLSSQTSLAQSQENKIQIGGIEISGGAFSLIGTASTAFGSGQIEYVGWGFIVVGSIINAGHVKSVNAAELPALTEEEARKARAQIKAEATVTNSSPELASSLELDDALNIFEMDTQDRKVKASRFSEVVLTIANSDTPEEYSDPNLAKELLGEQDGQVNREIVYQLSNLYSGRLQ